MNRAALLLLWLLAAPVLGWAADTTPPTTPVVTDDGEFTSNNQQLHASWTSADPESGIVEYQYLIQRDSVTGVVVLDWTSTGTEAEVTRTGFVTGSGKGQVNGLPNGVKFYFRVRARNAEGLWSAAGTSNGIKVDITPPPASASPREVPSGGQADMDYVSGAFSPQYYVQCPAVTDPETYGLVYEAQEREGVGSTWNVVGSTETYPPFLANDALIAVGVRPHGVIYHYRCRVRNSAQLWSAYSPESDGVTIDQTQPDPISVLDDGATTSQTAQLHMRWTASSDPESGIADYQYLILRDNTGPFAVTIVNWTSAGIATEFTRTGLALETGKTYFFCIRAYNGASQLAVACSDGITVQPDTTAPEIVAVTPAPAPNLYAGGTITLAAEVTDTDDSPLEYQFMVDGIIRQSWSAQATHAWSSAAAEAGPHTVTVQVRDAGGADSLAQTYYLYRQPPELP